MKRYCEELTKSQKDTHQASMVEKGKYENKIDKLEKEKTERDKKLEDEKNQHDEERKNLDEKGEQEKKKIKENYRTEIGNWESRCRDLEQELNGLKKFKEQKEIHEREVEELHNRLEKIKKEFQKERSEIADLNDKKVKEVIKKYEENDSKNKSSIRDQARKDLLFTQESHERFVDELRDDCKRQKVAIEDLKKKEEKFRSENRTITRDLEFMQQDFDEVNKSKIILSKKIKQYEEEIKVQKESLTQVVKEFEKEKELMKHHYEQEISKRNHENINLTEQLKVRNKEFSHVKGLAQMILDQRSEVETFFLEALEQIKHEHRKKQEQERREAGSNSIANRETREKQKYGDK